MTSRAADRALLEAARQRDDGAYRRRIEEITGFVAPELFAHFGLPDSLAG